MMWILNETQVQKEKEHMNRYHMAAVKDGVEVQHFTIEASNQDECIQLSWQFLEVALDGPGTREDRNPNNYSLRMKSHENSIV